MNKNLNNQRNPKGAGRKPKFTTKVLLEIIDIYKQHGLMKGSITFSEVAKFGKSELGYDDLRYYHLSNDKVICDLIKEYNESQDTLIGYFRDRDKLNSIININVIEFVEANYNNKQKLIMYLENYKKSYDITIKELLEEIREKRSLTKVIDELREEKEALSKRNRELRDENKTIKQDYRRLSKKVSEIGQSELVKSLKSTNLVLISEEEEETNDTDYVNLKSKNEDNGSNLELFFNRFPELFND